MRIFVPLRASVIGIVAVMAMSCDQNSPNPLNPPPQKSNSTAESSNPDFTVDIVTSNPQEFADALRKVGNGNEVLVVLKDSDVPPVAEEFLRELPLVADLVIATRDLPPGAERRGTPGLARASVAAQDALLRALSNRGVEPTRAGRNVLSLRIPDDKLIGVLAMLLHHPNVDYVEANQKRAVVLNMGDPVGTNSADIKHSFHNVLDAWDYTRGAGVKVGVLDSGMAWKSSTGEWHEDALLISASKGISKKGFIDDYDSYNNCDVTGGQPYGDCVLWDDNIDRHGTAMAGLVGGNDNSVGYVGIMPEGLTVSMKILNNGYVSDFDSCQGAGPYGGCIEDDDFYWAVEWANFNGIDILSMSFSGGWGSTVYNALYDSYHTHDILLLAATGNPNQSSSAREPAKWPFVMGIGGLDENGADYGLDEYEEVSALSGGGTMDASCNGVDFCTPDGYVFFDAPSGGTSSSTAITAGIAGLVRAYNPSLTAQQVRNRLAATASGPHNKVDALAAVLNILPLSVALVGPGYISTVGNYIWEAEPQHAKGSITYNWEFSSNGSTWSHVGSQSTYSRYVGSAESDFYLRVTITSAGETDSDSIHVTVATSCYPQIYC